MGVSLVGKVLACIERFKDPAEWNPERSVRFLAGHRWLGDTIGVAAFLLSFTVRYTLDSVLPPGLPFLTFFPAVILTTYFCGLRPGIVCAVLCGLGAWLFFVSPTHSLTDVAVLTALALYAFVVSVDIGLIHFLQRTATTLQRSRETERQLAEKTALLDIALRGAKAGIWTVAIGSGRAMLSAETARQHGLGTAQIEVDIEREWRPAVHPADSDRTLADLNAAVATRGPFETEFRVVLATGDIRWLTSMGLVETDEGGRATRVCGLSFDITERKQAEARIEALACYDGMTALANRRLFQERFAAEMAAAGRGNGAFALLCLDLDRFKAVNDTLGHLAGDALLCSVAERIKAEIRAEDLLARIGGDEFVIIQRNTADPLRAEALAERIIAAIEPAIAIEGQPVQVGISIGIALAPRDGDTCHDLYTNADRALYRAKNEGRNTFRFANETSVFAEPALPQPDRVARFRARENSVGAEAISLA